MSDKDASAQSDPAPGESTAPASGQASAGAASASATPPGQSPTSAPAGPGDGDGTPPDPAELLRRAESAERSAKDASAEAARYRRQLRDREQAEAAAKREGLDESAKLTADQTAFAAEKEAFERERLEFRLQQQMVREVGPKLNLIDPVDALWLIDWEQLDFDDEGNAKNLEALVRTLAEAKPYIVKAPSGPPPPPTAPTIGASSGAAPGPAPALTADELEAAKTTGMDPARYARLKGVKTLDDWTKITPGPAAPAPPTPTPR